MIFKLWFDNLLYPVSALFCNIRVPKTGFANLHHCILRIYHGFAHFFGTFPEKKIAMPFQKGYNVIL